MNLQSQVAGNPDSLEELMGFSDNLTYGFSGGLDSKESSYNAGDLGSIPGSGRSPGDGNGYSPQYSYRGEFHGQRSLAGCSP